MYGYIYKITNNVNKKFYIGKHKSDHFDNRYWGSGRIIKKALKKYCKSSFTREILCECNNIETLEIMEKFYIKELDSRSNGYNLALGGEGVVGIPCSEETREKIRKWWGENPMGIEQKAKLAEIARKRSTGKKYASKKIIALKEGTGERKEFESVKECAKFFYQTSGGMSNIIKGKGKCGCWYVFYA